MASGFALRRNGTCVDAQMDCGTTAAPYHACCPVGSSCPSQYNVNCCPTNANCTAALVANPQCANTQWDLYDNNGFFCCQPGRTGYATPDGSDGCAEPGYNFQSGERLLKIVSTGHADGGVSLPTASTSSGSSDSSSSTASPGTSTATSTTAPASSGGGLALSAKVGLGVGLGVGIPLIVIAAVLLVLWMRKRPARRKDNKLGVDNSQEPALGVLRGKNGGAGPSDL